jgi:hypothetical protein
MDIVKMLAELHAERDAVDAALTVLERLAQGRRRGRGRPPKWLTRATEEVAPPVVHEKRSLTPEAKKRMADAQKKRWAAYRKAKAEESK